MQHKTEVIAFLTEKMIAKISQIIALYVIANSEHADADEARKRLEMQELMEMFMKGGKFKDKDLPFFEKHAGTIREINGYATDIKFVEKTTWTI